MKPTGANTVSGEGIGDVSTVIGWQGRASITHPEGVTCMCILAQAFQGAPFSQALRQLRLPCHPHATEQRPNSFYATVTGQE